MTKGVYTIKPEGFQKLKNKIVKASDISTLAKAVLRPAAETIRDEAGEYPAQPPPKNPKYRYVRGSGTMYVPTGRIRRTSETLGKRWLVAVQPSRGRAIIHNYASYAPYVHGKRQATLHKRTGWKQLSAVAKERLPEIGRDVIRALRRELRK